MQNFDYDIFINQMVDDTTGIIDTNGFPDYKVMVSLSHFKFSKQEIHENQVNRNQYWESNCQ